MTMEVGVVVITICNPPVNALHPISKPPLSSKTLASAGAPLPAATTKSQTLVRQEEEELDEGEVAWEECPQAVLS
ncbi:hypothetical protein GUJ93_ZPchr0013g34078 [Zizania palustris]|uniref:Uncharacterized protein n=1 Tax=Zizania palustris TaxID=103762 RepID=A0A8J5WVR9_ZIZPA|nr:hypothetical protein GUJ93_ZPchr0013g34078 [Zizania palustris]